LGEAVWFGRKRFDPLPFSHDRQYSEDILETLISTLGIALFVAAAYGDVKTLKISNTLVAIVAALGILRLIVVGDVSIALYTVGATLLVFLVVFLLFWRGIIGGGDAKLMTATALLVGYNDLLTFFLLMSISGAFVSLAILVLHRRSKQPQAQAVPYGVAIAGGAIVTLLFQPSLLG
jgi:prepilin peptidase CpaA